MVNARGSGAEAEATARAIRDDGGEARVHLADVTDPAAVDGLMAAAASLGGIDILVNNAAVRRETKLADLELTEWREVLGVILDGAYMCTRAALPHLRGREPAASSISADCRRTPGRWRGRM